MNKFLKQSTVLRLSDLQNGTADLDIKSLKVGGSDYGGSSATGNPTDIHITHDPDPEFVLAVGTQTGLASGADPGDRSSIYYSTDGGYEFTPATITGEYSALCATHGNGVWVAGGLGFLTYSLDGINWSSATSPIINVRAVHFADGLFVAMGGIPEATAVPETHTIATSTDGINWTGRGTDMTNCFRLDHHDGVWVALNFSSKFAYSTDGINWTGVVGINDFMLDITYGDGKWVAVGEGFESSIFTSPDGITWTGNANIDKRFQHIGYNGTTYVADTIAPYELLYSSDLESWTSIPITETFGPPETRYIPSNGNWDGKKWLFNGSRGGVKGAVIVSADLVNWTTSLPLFDSGYITDIAIKPVKTPFVSIADGHITLNGQIKHTVIRDNSFVLNTWNFDADASMTQHLDAGNLTGTGAITFSNEVEGTTYVILLVQGSGNHNISLPYGWWLNDAVFDFSTLGDGGRVMITATHIYDTWHFSAKNLLLHVRS
jgi:hypothetical protein